MDLASISAGVAAAKAGFDALRSAIGLVKEIEGILPTGEQKDAVGASLAVAEQRLKIAEAQIAQGLGYPLCRCAFPPRPMLRIGYRRPQGGMDLAMAMQEQRYSRGAAAMFEVHQCPKCGRNDASPHPFTQEIT